MFELLPLPLQYAAAYLTLGILFAGFVAAVIYALRLLKNYRDAEKHALDTD
jgi:hypothetical protein